MNQKAIKRNMSEPLLTFMVNNKALIILILLCIGSAIASPNFLMPTNLMNVVRQVASSAVVAAGYTCVIGSGNMDLSVGNLVGLLGIIMGKMSVSGAPFIVCLLAGMLIGMACGFINGYVGTTFGIPMFIITLATGQVFKGVGQLLSNTTAISGISPWFKTIGQGYTLGIPHPIYIMVGIAAIAWIMLNRTKLGRNIISVGGNREAARICGINDKRVTVTVYVIMGFCAAVTALILTGRAYSAQPTAGAGMEMDAIAAVVIGGTSLGGGTAKVVGSVIGCLIVGIITNALNLAGVDSNWQLIAKGALIVLAVLLDVLSTRYFNARMKKAGAAQ